MSTITIKSNKQDTDINSIMKELNISSFTIALDERVKSKLVQYAESHNMTVETAIELLIKDSLMKDIKKVNL